MTVLVLFKFFNTNTTKTLCLDEGRNFRDRYVKTQKINQNYQHEYIPLKASEKACFVFVISGEPTSDPKLAICYWI